LCYAALRCTIVGNQLGAQVGGTWGPTGAHGSPRGTTGAHGGLQEPTGAHLEPTGDHLRYGPVRAAPTCTS
jgi:hypothetical protein